MTELKTASGLIPAAARKGDALVASLSGEIDMSNSPQVRAGLFALVRKFTPHKLVLDLSDVPYMDSSAIAVLVEQLREIRKIGGKVYLCALQPRVKDLLEIARLDTLFNVVPSIADAGV